MTNPAVRSAEPRRRPRICMPSWRKFKKYAFQSTIYEAQDVLTELDDVDLICPAPSKSFEFKDKWQKRLIWRDPTKRLVFANPGLEPVQLSQDYDLFVAFCQNWWDVLYLNSIKGWKDRCKVSICWFDELYIGSIAQDKELWLHALDEFDHVVLCFRSTVGPLQKAIRPPCQWVASAVDMLRFSPNPNPPERVIDVYSMGRRWEGVHTALLNLRKEKNIFYLHDTFPGSMAHPPDFRQHRDMLANLMKRSRFFTVQLPKMDFLQDSGGQQEIGYRFFEGAVAGTIMLGQIPNCESFRMQFNWPNSVVPIQPDGSDVAEIMMELSSDPDRLQEMWRRNARESLLRHDWVYRWREILKIAGLEPTPAYAAREDYLKEMAGLEQAQPVR